MNKKSEALIEHKKSENFLSDIRKAVRLLLLQFKTHFCVCCEREIITEFGLSMIIGRSSFDFCQYFIV